MLHLRSSCACLLLLASLAACDQPADSAETEAGGSSASAQLPATGQDRQWRFRALPERLRGAGRLYLADVTGDKLPDAVAASQPPPGAEGAQPTSFQVFIGNGQGGFTVATRLQLTGQPVSRIASGDFDQSGTADLALASHDSYELQLLYGDGTGRFAPGEPLTMYAGEHPHTHSLVVADMNGDGLDDLLTSCADDGKLAVQLGQADGSFLPAPGSPFAAARHPYEGLACVDLDGDARLDAVVVDLMGSAVSVLHGDGTGALAPFPGSPYAVGERPGYSAVGDLDGDGKLDIVASHDDTGTLAVFYGNGQGGFAAAPGSPFDPADRTWHVALADLDGDGQAELLTGDIDSGDVLIRPGGRYRGALPVAQAVPTDFPPGPDSNGGYFSVADLNGDGKPDIVASQWDSGDAVVLLQE